MKTRTCTQCRQQLELTKTNFRFSGGYFRHTCIGCVNARKRRLYQIQKAEKPPVINLAKLRRKARVELLAEQYAQAIQRLHSNGLDVNCLAEAADKVLRANPRSG